MSDLFKKLWYVPVVGFALGWFLQWPALLAVTLLFTFVGIIKFPRMDDSDPGSVHGFVLAWAALVVGALVAWLTHVVIVGTFALPTGTKDIIQMYIIR